MQANSDNVSRQNRPVNAQELYSKIYFTFAKYYINTSKDK